jgi:hypothetical protein
MLGTELDRGWIVRRRDVDVWNVESIGIRITHVGRARRLQEFGCNLGCLRLRKIATLGCNRRGVA